MDCYSTLKIPLSATDEDIKKAYRKIILKLHPDKYNGNSEIEKNNLVNQFIKVNEAFDILKNPERRKIYDLKGYDGLKEHDNKINQENALREARDKNNKRREERKKRQEQKELEKKQKELEEKRKKEIEELELKRKKVQEEKERLLKEEFERKRKIEIIKKKKLEAEIREKELAEKRQREIEEENKARQQKIELEKEKKKSLKQEKINKKKEILNNYTEFYLPFVNIINHINEINMSESDSNSYIINHILEKTTEIIINLDDKMIKEFYLKLKKIKDYYENDFNDITNKKNIRGKVMLKTFFNICNDYDLDKYIIEKYEEHLKKSNLYDSNNFCFLEKIVGTYLKIIQTLIPNIYFL
jgi:curved DNA-binding protein CbpA